MYVFHSWPDGGSTHLKQMRVRKITRLTGRTHDTVYQVDLAPSGRVIAREYPVLKGNTYVLHTWRDGECLSLRQTDVRKITVLTGDRAFWAEQSVLGASHIGNVAMEGATVVELGGPAPQSGSSQAGPSNLSSLGSNNAGGSSNNWYYGGTPGVSDAWAPANARVDHPGDVPRMPDATPH